MLFVKCHVAGAQRRTMLGRRQPVRVALPTKATPFPSRRRLRRPESPTSPADLMIYYSQLVTWQGSGPSVAGLLCPLEHRPRPPAAGANRAESWEGTESVWGEPFPACPKLLGLLLHQQSAPPSLALSTVATRAETRQVTPAPSF